MNGNPEFVPPSPSNVRTEVIAPPVIKKVSWGAIFAGAFVSLAVLATLALLGLAVGLGAFNPNRYSNPMAGVGVGTGIWWLIISIIAFFVGGWVASRLVTPLYKTENIIHGIASWAVACVGMMILATTAAGMIMGGTLGVVGNALSGNVPFPVVQSLFNGNPAMGNLGGWGYHTGYPVGAPMGYGYNTGYGYNNPNTGAGMSGSGMGGNTGTGYSNSGTTNYGTTGSNYGTSGTGTTNNYGGASESNPTGNMSGSSYPSGTSSTDTGSYSRSTYGTSGATGNEPRYGTGGTVGGKSSMRIHEGKTGTSTSTTTTTEETTTGTTGSSTYGGTSGTSGSNYNTGVTGTGTSTYNTNTGTGAYTGSGSGMGGTNWSDYQNAQFRQVATQAAHTAASAAGWTFVMLILSLAAAALGAAISAPANIPQTRSTP